MKRSTIRDRVIDIILETLLIESVLAADRLEDIDLDGTDEDFLAALQNEFKVTVEKDDASEWETVSDIIDTIFGLINDTEE